MFFRRFLRKSDGRQLIDRAVGKFKSIIADIDRGITLNNRQISANGVVIAALGEDTAARKQHNNQGQRIADKLREFIA